MQKNIFDLSGKTVIVAGGAGYLGMPSCEALLGNGATVLIADINAEKLEAAENNFVPLFGKDRISVFKMDASDSDSIKAMFYHARQKYGGLYGFVNATYMSISKKVEDLLPEEFDKANHVNITASFLMARCAAEAIENNGSIVMFSSMYGLVSPDPHVYEKPMNPNPIEYGAGKAAIIQMTKYLAAHYGHRNIRVNAVAPGPFPFPSLQEKEPEFIQRLAKKTMLGRIGRQEELAGAVVYLISNASSYVTGQCIVVDGGWTAW